MRSSSFTANTNALASDMNKLRADAQGASFLLVNQQASPGMTVQVQAGVVFIGSTKVTYAGGNSGTITAPVSNPRIDILTIDTSGTIGITTGVENASPVAPTYPTNKMVLAEITNRVGETTILDNANQTAGQGFITDVRPFLNNVSPSKTNQSPTTLNSSNTNNSGRPQLHVASIACHAGSGAGAAGTITLTAVVAGVTESEAAVQTSSTTTRIDMELILTFLVLPGEAYEIDTAVVGTAGVGSVISWRIYTL